MTRRLNGQTPFARGTRAHFTLEIGIDVFGAISALATSWWQPKQAAAMTQIFFSAMIFEGSSYRIVRTRVLRRGGDVRRTSRRPLNVQHSAAYASWGGV